MTNEPLAVRRPEEAVNQLPPHLATQIGAVMDRQVRLYTNLDSSSVPAETAAELLHSVLLSAREGLAAMEGPAAPGADTSSLGALVLAGQRRLTRATQKAQRRLQLLKTAAQPLGSLAMRDTLKALEAFFTAYDIRFMAHAIPCMIDYPLCLPVPERLPGIRYIDEYIRRLMAESVFCRAFDPQKQKALLRRFQPEYKKLIVNLFEPVLANALGLAAIGQDARTLKISDGERRQIEKQFSDKTQEEITSLLQKTATNLCNQLGLWRQNLRGYVSASAAGLTVRIHQADVEGLATLFAGV